MLQKATIPRITSLLLLSLLFLQETKESVVSSSSSSSRQSFFMSVLHLSVSVPNLIITTAASFILTFMIACAIIIAVIDLKFTTCFHSLSSSVIPSVIITLFISFFAPVGTVEPDFKWSPRHVDTKMGVVQGYVVYPNGFSGVEVMLNLPYASPPVGSLRFMPPVSGSPWSGVRRSEKFGPVCPQVFPDIRNETEALMRMPRGKLNQLRRLLPHLKNQSEDCLFLNLYIPLAVAEEREKEKLPILVFVHGDDYSFGSGNPYDPSMLVSYGNVIAVTFNYRLGILGFLNANSDSHFRLPYNFAMLDQIAALQWIQENIELFGGDRNNVTLMGHGKGAVLVNFLMISNAVPTGLLFHRVILSSDSALSPATSDLTSGLELSRRFAKRVRCPSEPSSTMLECLREVPLGHFLDSELWSLFGPSEDQIVVRSEMLSENAIMNKASHYPLLFGAVKVEALPSLSNHDASYGMENERRRELLRHFINKNYRFHRNEILAGAIHEYTDWEKPVQHPQNVREETLDALADAQVVAPLTKMGDLHSQSSRSRAYFYVFEYQSKSSEYQQRLGCVHGEELFYVFGVPLFFYDYESESGDTEPEMTRRDASISSGGGDYGSSSSVLPFPRKTSGVKGNELGFFTGNFTWYEVQLSLTVMRFWTNFVRVGNPSGDTDLSAGGQEWHRHQVQKMVKAGAAVGSPSSSSLLTDAGSSKSSRSSGIGGGGSRTDTTLLRTKEMDGSNQLSHKPKQRQHQQQQQEQQMPGPILIEWPQYESLDKKYLVLDLRPKIRSHYRAHKLSFWLHLVPDYQKNDEGTSITSIHHGIVFTNASVAEMNANGKNVSNHAGHTMIAYGLYDLSQTSVSRNAPGSVPRDPTSLLHNSSLASKSKTPKLSSGLPGSEVAHEPKEQQDSGESGLSSSDLTAETGLFGFESYSTALSVTIAIGCTLFILNLLIFATFYYERERRFRASTSLSKSTHSSLQMVGSTTSLSLGRGGSSSGRNNEQQKTTLRCQDNKMEEHCYAFSTSCSCSPRHVVCTATTTSDTASPCTSLGRTTLNRRSSKRPKHNSNDAKSAFGGVLVNERIKQEEQIASLSRPSTSYPYYAERETMRPTTTTTVATVLSQSPTPSPFTTFDDISDQERTSFNYYDARLGGVDDIDLSDLRGYNIVDAENGMDVSREERPRANTNDSNFSPPQPFFSSPMTNRGVGGGRDLDLNMCLVEIPSSVIDDDGGGGGGETDAGFGTRTTPAFEHPPPPSSFLLQEHNERYLSRLQHLHDFMGEANPLAANSSFEDGEMFKIPLTTDPLAYREPHYCMWQRRGTHNSILQHSSK